MGFLATLLLLVPPLPAGRMAVTAQSCAAASACAGVTNLQAVRATGGTMAWSKWLILIMMCYRAVVKSIFLNFKPQLIHRVITSPAKPRWERSAGWASMRAGGWEIGMWQTHAQGHLCQAMGDCSDDFFPVHSQSLHCTSDQIYISCLLSERKMTKNKTQELQEAGTGFLGNFWLLSAH